MKKKIIVIFSIFSIITLSIFCNIFPVKINAHSIYSSPEWQLFRISGNDKGYISVNNAYEYIMQTGASENDDLYIINYYQTSDDDNEYFRIIGFNALDNNNTAQVYIKIVFFDAQTGIEKEIYRQQINQYYYFYTWFYCIPGQYGNTIAIGFYDGIIPNNNEYFYELYTSATGYNWVSYIETSFIYIKNDNQGYTTQSLIIQEMQDTFNNPYIQDWFTYEISNRYNYNYEIGYDEGYDMGYNRGYTRGYDMGYEQGNMDGYDEGLTEGYTSGLNTGKAVGYNQGIAENLSSNWLTDTFSSISNVLAIEIFPGFKLGYLLAIPLIFGVLRIIISIWRA